MNFEEQVKQISEAHNMQRQNEYKKTVMEFYSSV